MKLSAPYAIEAYLKKVQKFNCNDEVRSILKYIEEQKSSVSEDSDIFNLFLAEEAFYRGQYKKALKYYLQAKGVPHFEFFCFRASAYASEEMNNYLKAIQFAKKSLQIMPEDYPTLTLLARTYTSIDQRDKAQVINQKLDILATTELKEEKNNSNQEDLQHFIPVGEQELEELSKIFSIREPGQSNLFANEPSTPTKHTYEFDTSMPPHFPVESAVLLPGSDLFSHSPKPWESEESLTKRLYETYEPSPAHSVYPKVFLSAHEKQLEEYHQIYRKNTKNRTNFLLCSQPVNHSPFSYPIHTLIYPPNRCFLVHWQGHGIAVNPGKNFLESLHNHSLFLQDIQTVIVTEATPDSIEELTTLYTLSSKLSDLHLSTPIAFYVHSYLYEQLKRLWPNHQYLYTLVNSWSPHEKIHCSTCQSNGAVYGITLRCQDQHVQPSITYLAKQPQEYPSSDILLMDTSCSDAEAILRANPKITILYDSTGLPAQKRLDIIKRLQNLVMKTNQILPSPDYLFLHLDSLKIQAAVGEQAFAISELCAVSASSSTVKLVPRESIVLYS